MKYVKMLGLAAVAALALMAFGAGSASATTLCTTKVESCPAAWHESTGAEIHATLTKDTTAVLESGEVILDTCTGSTMKGKTANTGGKGVSVEGPIETLTWENCSRPTATLSMGSLVLHYKEGNDGTATATGKTEVTINTIFGSCVYGSGTGITLGTVKGGNPATLNISTSVPKISGNFACPSAGLWTANYTITNPAPLYIANE